MIINTNSGTVSKEFLETSDINFFSVCESPTYIEARERETNKTWMGLDSTLIYLVKSNDENPSWAIGFSKDFGYVRHLLISSIIAI